MDMKIKSVWNQFKILRSLKARIFIIVFLIGIIPSIIMRFGILNSYEDRAVSLRTSDVQRQLNIIANHLITYNYLTDTSSEVISAELEQLSNLYDGRVIIINSNLKIIKDTYGISEGKTVISEDVVKCMKGGAGGSAFNDEYDYIEFTTPILEVAPAVETAEGEKPAQKGKEKRDIVRGVMLTSVSTDSIVVTMDIMSRKALIMEIMMVSVIFVIALVLVRILTKPFERVTKAISEVREGFTDEPVSVPDYLETEHIVDAFNQLLTRMQALDTSRQEFVSNVSHELKTPITSVKVLADSLLAQPDAPAELYREFLVDIAEEIDREDKIINDLLSMVKMDKKVATMNVSAVDINALTEIILKRLRPIPAKGILNWFLKATGRCRQRWTR